VSPAKTAEPIEMPLGTLTHLGPLVSWSQGRTNPFAAARGDKAAMLIESSVSIPNHRGVVVADGISRGKQRDRAASLIASVKLSTCQFQITVIVYHVTHHCMTSHNVNIA